jgi:catechol 2,3-dioxygenase-like lactoylglutathione lyase family enzyme
MTSAEGIIGLDQVVLPVPALDRSIAVYRSVFGLEPRARGEGWARFALANTALVLTQDDGPRMLAFRAASLDPAARLIARRGLPGAGRDWLGAPAVALDPAAARGLSLLLTANPAAPAEGPRLDHAVIRSADPERSIAVLAGRLGLDLRLDRSNPAWGQRLLFFRCGDTVVEVSHPLAEGLGDAPDRLWGLTWGVPDAGAWHERLSAAGMDISPLRTGRKPGTRIFTVRDRATGLPTAILGA